MSELQVLHNKAACLILDLPARSSGADALKRLGWKPLLRHRKEYRASFMYKLLINHFTFNSDFHSYYTRSARNDNRKSSAKRRWGHWSSVNFSANVWNGLDTLLKNSESLLAFKRGLSKVIYL